MNHTLFMMYMETKNLLKRAPDRDDFRNLVCDWEKSIAILDNISPEFKYNYDRLVKNQESFTPEQIDFICYQIGEWYLAWKDRIIIDLHDGTHRLGYAKERLKEIICGG